jgi:hypothetical protein
MSPTIRRTRDVPMPTAWAVLAHEWWGVERGLVWAAWQAMASCAVAPVVQFRHKLLLWPTVATGRAAAVRHGLTPCGVLDIIERLARDGRLTQREAATIEEAMLAHVDAHGVWKE